MALPIYGEPQVAPQAAPEGLTQAQASPETFGAGVGGALVSAGEIAARAQEEAKNIRVNDQVNQIQERALDLAYGKDGYRSVLGGNVLKLPSGKPLTQDYGDKFEAAATQARNNLSTPQQQALFDRRMILIRRNFMRGLEGHDQEQIHAFADATDKSTIGTQADAAVRFWNDPDYTHTASAASDAAWASMGQRNGWPADKIAQLQQESRSDLYSKVLAAAVDAGDVDYASKYLKTFGSDMTGEDAMRAGVLVNGKAADNLAFGVAQATTAAWSERVRQQTDPGSALTRAALQQAQDAVESGNDPNAVSLKGAKGLNQVMDATNRDPGFGVTPARDDSPEERYRVGKDYLSAMIVRYGGDVEKALAAYNAGPGKLDDALAEAAKPANQGMRNPDGSPKGWLDYLPGETQKYVPAVLRAAGAQVRSAPTIPDEQVFVADAVARAQARVGQLSPVQQQKVINAAQSAHAQLVKGYKEQGDQAFAQAMSAVSGGTPFEALPSDLVGRVPGTDLPRLREFSDKMQRGLPVQTDPRAYDFLASNPDQLYLMPAAEFAAYQARLSKADFDHFTNERAALQSGASSHSPLVLNRPVVNATVNQMLAQIGLPTSPKQGSPEAAATGAVRQIVESSLIAQQRFLGKQLAPDQVAGAVGKMFLQEGPAHHYFWSNGTQRLFAMRPGDVPAADADDLRARLVASGLTNPTPQDVLSAYQQRELVNRGVVPK